MLLLRSNRLELHMKTHFILEIPLSRLTYEVNSKRFVVYNEQNRIKNQNGIDHNLLCHRIQVKTEMAMVNNSIT